MIKTSISNICTAFEKFAIGSKVNESYFFNKETVYNIIKKSIELHDPSNDRAPGQHFIICPELIPYFSAGDGPKLKDPNAYHVLMHRDQVGLYLKREFAGETNSCALIVDTLEAYLNDPEVEEKEADRIKSERATHVILAVLASSGPPSPLTPWRFVSNLAGGNNEALIWTADEIRNKAKEIKEYWSNYSVVAG